MAHVLPLDHKQIAYVSYDPEERTLIVTYHRGMSRTHLSIDMDQFQSLSESNNKVDELIRLLSKRYG
jgi:hypothetical protein